MTNELCLTDLACELMESPRVSLTSFLLASAQRRLVAGLAQIVVEPVEALLPVFAIGLHPLRCFAHGPCAQATGTPLRLAALADQPRALQHFQMLGDRRQAHVEGLGELGDRCFAGSEPRQDGAPSW